MDHQLEVVVRDPPDGETKKMTLPISDFTTPRLLDLKLREQFIVQSRLGDMYDAFEELETYTVHYCDDKMRKALQNKPDKQLYWGRKIEAEPIEVCISMFRGTRSRIDRDIGFFTSMKCWDNEDGEYVYELQVEAFHELAPCVMNPEMVTMFQGHDKYARVTVAVPVFTGGPFTERSTQGLMVLSCTEARMCFYSTTEPIWEHGRVIEDPFARFLHAMQSERNWKTETKTLPTPGLTAVAICKLLHELQCRFGTFETYKQLL